MKFMLSLLAFGYVALANAAPSLPVHPGGIGGIFKGPNSETIIKGPDGSIITAAAEGGAVQTDVEPIVVAEPAIVQEAAPVAIAAAPVAVAAAPVAVAAAPVVEAVAVPAPVVESEQGSDLIGPSGRIATKGSAAVIAGPASTTVTGPAVVAETVVKGPPIIGPPILAAAPIAATAEVAPIAVTASPIAAVTAAPLPSVVTGGAPVSVSAPSLATVSALPSIAAVTAAPRIIATASASPHLSVASASAADGAILSASAAPNQAAAVVENRAISTVTQLPVLPSPEIGRGLVGINRADLTPQVIHDQLAIDNRQLNLNPALISPANIIPPEIAVTPRLPVERLRPTPGPLVTLGVRPTQGTLLTTPGLGAVGTGTNIQREEEDTLTVTQNVPQVAPQEVALTPQQISGLQSQQALLNNQVQQTLTVPSNIQRNEDPSGVTPNTLQTSPQLSPNLLQINRQVALSQDQLAALQNQQALLNNQIQQAQAGLGPNIQTSSTGPALFTPNIENRQAPGLANIPQQNLLSTELAKSGIDASQVQLTNVPLSSVPALPVSNLRRSGINDGLSTEAWGRFSRETEKEKEISSEKKTRSD